MPLDRGGTARKTSVGEQVFLSPRVVDESAFEDFAARLRREVNSAAGEREQLRTLIDEVRRAGGQLDEITKRFREQAGQAGELSRGVERNKSEVAAMLEELRELRGAHERFCDQLDESVAQRTVEMSQHVDAALQRFQLDLRGATGEADRRVADRIADLDTARAHLDEMASERIVAFSSQLATAGEAALSKVDREVARGEQAAAHVEQRIERMLERLEKTLETRLENAVAEAEERIAMCEASAREQLADVETARAALEAQVDGVVNRALKELRDATVRAETVLGDAGKAESLRGGLERAESLVERIETATEQGAKCEARLGASFGDINAAIDEASRRYVALEATLRKGIKASNAAEQLLASRSDSIGGLTRSLEGAQSRADQAVRTLERNALRAETASEGGEAKLARLEQLVGRAEQLITELEPWRGAMLAQAATGELPKDLEALVREVRRGVLKRYMQGGKQTPAVGEQIEAKGVEARQPESQSPPAA